MLTYIRGQEENSQKNKGTNKKTHCKDIYLPS